MSEERRRYVVSADAKARPVERSKTDFSTILTDLRDWGFNDYKMAELTGVERTKLTKLRADGSRQPNYDDGVAIMRVYKAERRKHTKRGP